MPYLTETDARRVLSGIVDAFPSGELLFDTVSASAWRTSKWDPLGRRYNAVFRCGFDDPSALADWHPKLAYVGEAPMNDSPILRAKAPASVRRLYRINEPVPGIQTIQPHGALPVLAGQHQQAGAWSAGKNVKPRRKM